MGYSYLTVRGHITKLYGVNYPVDGSEKSSRKPILFNSVCQPRPLYNSPITLALGVSEKGTRRFKAALFYSWRYSTNLTTNEKSVC